MSTITSEVKEFPSNLRTLRLDPLGENDKKAMARSRDAMMDQFRKGKLDLGGMVMMTSCCYMLAKTTEEVHHEGVRFLGAFVEHFRRRSEISEDEALQLVDESMLGLVVGSNLQFEEEIAGLQTTLTGKNEEIERLQEQVRQLQEKKMDVAATATTAGNLAQRLLEKEKLLEQRDGEIAQLRAAANKKPAALETKNTEHNQETKDGLIVLVESIRDVQGEIEELKIGNSLTGAEVTAHDRKKRMIARAMNSIAWDVSAIIDNV